MHVSLVYGQGIDSGETAIETPSIAVEDIELAANLDEKFAADPSLEQTKELIELGSRQLAYFFIKRKLSDSSYSEDPKEWEKLFYETAVELKDWKGIFERSNKVTRAYGPDPYLTAQTLALQALIRLGEYEVTRNRLKRLIWDFDYRIDELISLRELIIQTYIAEAKIEDARVSLAAFNTEYRPNDLQFELRYARILILSGMYKEAQARLVGLQTKESELLYFISQFKNNEIPPFEALQTGLEKTSEYGNEPSLLLELWAVIEEAARQLKDFEMQIFALESALSIPIGEELEPLLQLMTSLININYLVKVYNEYALEVGNSFELLVGDDLSWQRLAREFEITSQPTARALHSFLAMNTVDNQIRQASISALADSLEKERLYRVLELFLISSRIYDISAASETVQLNTAIRMLRRQNYQVALKIMNGMDKPSDEKRALLWYLRRARTAILVKDYELAVTLLLELINSLPPEVEKVTLDRITFVAFDFQEANKHLEATKIFRALFELANDIQSKREFLRWIADSYSKQKKFLEAAELLLRSAQLGGNWNDEWGQAARLAAADALTESEFFEDARNIYLGLKDDTLDPRGKELIDNRVKKIPSLR